MKKRQPNQKDPEFLFFNKYNTLLSDNEEVKFQNWVNDESKKIGRDLAADLGTYDLRGWWKNDKLKDKDGHFSDKWKKPNHPKYSNESIYNKEIEGGTWSKDGGFTPSKYTLDLYGVEGIKRYFNEPDRPEYLNVEGLKDGGKVMNGDDKKKAKLKKPTADTLKFSNNADKANWIAKQFPDRSPEQIIKMVNYMSGATDELPFKSVEGFVWDEDGPKKFHDMQIKAAGLDPKDYPYEPSMPLPKLKDGGKIDGNNVNLDKMKNKNPKLKRKGYKNGNTIELRTGSSVEELDRRLSNAGAGATTAQAGLAGAMSGASSLSGVGAGIGTLAGGPAGAAIGGLAGAVVGGLGGAALGTSSAKKAQIDLQNQIARERINLKNDNYAAAVRALYNNEIGGENAVINAMEGTVTADEMKSGGYVSRYKAKKILKDGTVHGKPLTDKQKRYFGAIAGGVQMKADGGDIEGAGGPKDDAIKAEMEEGGFVVPAENRRMAVKLRKKYFPDTVGKEADLKGGNVPVKLSDGEHYFTPEEAAILREDGVNIDALAPNADKGSKAMAEGGEIIVGGKAYDPSKIRAIRYDNDVVDYVLVDDQGKTVLTFDKRERGQLNQQLDFSNSKADEKGYFKVDVRPEYLDKGKAGIQADKQDAMAKEAKLKAKREEYKELGFSGVQRKKQLEELKGKLDHASKNYEESGDDYWRQQSQELSNQIRKIEGLGSNSKKQSESNSEDAASSDYDKQKELLKYQFDRQAEIARLNNPIYAQYDISQRTKAEEEANKMTPFEKSAMDDELETARLMKEGDTRLDADIAKRENQAAIEANRYVNALKIADEEAAIGAPSTAADPALKKPNFDIGAVNAIVGGLQTGVGLWGTLNQGARPSVNRSPELSERLNRARADERIGLTPTQKTVLDRDIASRQNAQIRRSVELSGGNRNIAMAGINLANIEAGKAKLRARIADEDIKLQKRRLTDTYLRDVNTDARYVQESNLAQFDLNRASFENLLNTGVSNVLGTAQYIDTRNRLNKLKQK